MFLALAAAGYVMTVQVPGRPAPMPVHFETQAACETAFASTQGAKDPCKQVQAASPIATVPLKTWGTKPSSGQRAMEHTTSPH